MRLTKKASLFSEAFLSGGQPARIYTEELGIKLMQTNEKNN